MTTNRRLQALLLIIQLLGVLLLTQNWFSVAMHIDGKETVLGSFDGATTYPAAMPAALLATVAIVVSFLVIGWARRIVLIIGTVVTLLSAFWLSIQISTQNIAALDVQLDRLTGIAKTHGVAGLSVSTTLCPWLWVSISALSILIGLRLAFSRAPFIRQTVSKGTPQREELSAIDLWEQQRD